MRRAVARLRATVLTGLLSVAACRHPGTPLSEPRPLTGSERAIVLLAARGVAAQPELRGTPVCVGVWVLAQDTSAQRALAAMFGATKPPQSPDAATRGLGVDCAAAWQPPALDGRDAPVIFVRRVSVRGDKAHVMFGARASKSTLSGYEVELTRRAGTWVVGETRGIYM